jgi:flagellar FliL protein
MSDATPEASRRSKLPLVLGLLLALGFGAGGFYLAFSGFDPASVLGEAEHEPKLPPVAFVPIEPLVVTLGGNGARNLRFEGNLEVDPAHRAEVAALMPRIMDVLNGYLRATELSDLRDPASLIRLRAQMLRRIQMVTDEGQVRDLLVTKFLIS